MIPGDDAGGAGSAHKQSLEGIVTNPAPKFDALSSALMIIDSDINSMELILNRLERSTSDLDLSPLVVQVTTLSTWLETVVDAGEVSMEETLEVRAQADALLSEMEWIEELAGGACR